jgi:DNA invertase Pin-like site-specific DNA recombinase
MPATVKKLRCAVYTRKSTDEGLEKEFNTLDAQRDACEAYVASQRAEGWVLVRDRYDDGGFSGGTLERPALKRLLARHRAGQGRRDRGLQDRPPEPLADGLREAGGGDGRARRDLRVVTQSFNTTTSMGRLTLNILLSFAQFEREVIGERIRDKFAASRARGMWMGGKVPLGYDVKDRKLIPNEDEAPRVRRVFELFVETNPAPRRPGGCRPRRDQPLGPAARQGRRLQAAEPADLRGRGDAQGAGVSRRASRHRVAGAVGPGARHPADQPARPGQPRQHAPALLKGLIFGTDGRALSPTHAVRRGRLYRYYVAQRVLKGDAPDDDSIVRRVSAAAIETAVMDQVRALLRQPEVVVGTWRAAQAEAPGPDRARDAGGAAAAGSAMGRAVPGGAGADRAGAGRAGDGRTGRRGYPAAGRRTGRAGARPGRDQPERAERGGMSEAASITVRVPLKIGRKAGRKTVVMPVQEGEDTVRTRPTRRW